MVSKKFAKYFISANDKKLLNFSGVLYTCENEETGGGTIELPEK